MTLEAFLFCHIIELRDMVSLLRRSDNNLNQIAKRMNETSRIYAADNECLLENQEKLWSAAKEILGGWQICGNGIGTRRERR